jgi:hypothetical protein
MKIPSRFYTDLHVEYKNEGFSAIRMYSFPNSSLEIYKGLIQGTSNLFIGIRIKNWGLRIHSSGEFAKTIEKLSKQKKSSKIIQLCLEKLIANKKVFPKFCQNLYAFGHSEGQKEVRNVLRETFGFLNE